MNIFRLVLCLAGLAAYLVAKEWLYSGPPSSHPAESSTPSHAEALKAHQGIAGTKE